MRGADIQLLVRKLQEAHIAVCIIGEIALNYYNVPRMIHVCHHLQSHKKFAHSGIGP